MHQAPALAVMAKAPICGSVKTRLAREIGAVAATAAYRTLTAALLRTLGRDPRWRLILAVTPQTAIAARYACWGFASKRTAQSRGGLGVRMQAIFQRLGARPAIIVGSDIPFVRAGTVAFAFRALRGARAVFGPAEDGGYWLVGLRGPLSGLEPFKNVRWSSSHALTDTLENMKDCRIALTAQLFDVDTASDYRRFRCLSSARRQAAKINAP